MLAKLFGSRKRKLSTLAVLALLALGGTALAAWLVTGTGTFQGQAATLQAPSFNITGVTLTSPGAYPGGATDLSYNVGANPNGNSNVHVTAVTVTGATFVSSDEVNCPATNWSLDQTKFSAAWSSISNAGGLVGLTSSGGAMSGEKVTSGLKLAAAAPDGCQGKTVTVTLAPNAVSWST